MLCDMAGKHTGKPKGNKIIAVIKYISPHKGKHLPTDESYKQRKARTRKAANELLQKEIMSKLCKWDAVCRKAIVTRTNNELANPSPAKHRT